PYVVFANSCGSARTARWEDHEDRTYELVRAFLGGGVKCYVGSLAGILDRPSQEFALAFYTQFLALRKEIGEALHAARLQLKATRESDLTWASYVLYGDPTF